MTERDTPAGRLFDGVGLDPSRIRATLPAFTIVGIIQGLLTGILIQMNFPLVVFTFPEQGLVYPMLSLVPNGPLVAHPLPGTFAGLRPVLLSVYIVVVVLNVVAVTLALASVAWQSDSKTVGWLPPFRRVLWLGVFVGVAILASVPALVAWIPLIGPLPSTILTVVLVYLLARLFAAPVTIVRDGRNPLAAIRWSWGVSGGTYEVALTILILGLCQYWFSGFPWFFVLSDSTAVLVGTVVGTTVFGSTYAALMCATYEVVPMDQWG